MCDWQVLFIHIVFQVNHIFQLFARFINGMVVVIRKEVRDAVGIGKSAVLVKRNRQWAVSGSYEHCPASACIMSEKILYQFLPVSPTLELRINGNVLYLKTSSASRVTTQDALILPSSDNTNISPRSR